MSFPSPAQGTTAEFLCLLGKNSLILMCTHFSILEEIFKSFDRTVLGHPEFTGGITLLYFLLTLLLTYPLVWLFHHKFPFFLGKAPLSRPTCPPGGTLSPSLMLSVIRQFLGLSGHPDLAYKLHWTPRQTWLAFFLLAFGTYHWMIDGHVGFGKFKLLLMVIMVAMLPFSSSRLSKGLLMGTLYIGWQWGMAALHPESWRWSTLLFSAGLCFMYVSFYNFIYVKKTLTIRHFLKILHWMMLAYFLVCILQQACLLVGIQSLPLINHHPLGRGIGCYSISIEPSIFARFMLVCYYGYLKCHEWLRGKGKFTPRELLQGEHKWVTLRFLWMMTTMGSGTAYGCLVLLSLYFVTPKNIFYTIPILLACYFGASRLEIQQFDRATSVINAVALRTEDALAAADGSGMIRIAPLLNSFTADFTDPNTWFGHGVDYAKDNNLVVTQKGTPFDDYGLIWLLLGYLFSFSCAYKINDLSALFMLVGVAGCCFGNIHYAWELAMLMTCLRFFGEKASISSTQNQFTNLRFPAKNYL